MRRTCFSTPTRIIRETGSTAAACRLRRHAGEQHGREMVRKYIGNGQWADVPGTAPTKTTTNLDLDAALEEVATRFLYISQIRNSRAATASSSRSSRPTGSTKIFSRMLMVLLSHIYTLRKFASKLFNSVELLKPLKAHYEELFDEFRAYKGKIPVCGCVSRSSLTKVVLVQNWAKTSWGLPER